MRLPRTYRPLWSGAVKVDVEVSTKVSRTVRARQLLSMFDVPDHPRSELSWHGDIDLDGEWSVGLIVGPSGADPPDMGTERAHSSVVA